MPSVTYALFRNAILAQEQVTCTYDGRCRELCPHIIGTNNSGKEVVLAWQFAGDSSGRLPTADGGKKKRPLKYNYYESIQTNQL
jgi:hypothetical protein